MAKKSFKQLSDRNRGRLVGEIYKLIIYYGNIFVPRKRSYIKEICSKEDCIYWLDDGKGDLVAMAVLEPDFVFEISGIKFKTVNYFISKYPGLMDRIFDHIWDDNKDCNLLLIGKKTVVRCFDKQKFNLTEFAPEEVLDIMPPIAQTKTNFYNISQETLYNGMIRNQNCLYLSPCSKDKAKLAEVFPKIKSRIN